MLGEEGDFLNSYEGDKPFQRGSDGDSSTINNYAEGLLAKDFPERILQPSEAFETC